MALSMWHAGTSHSRWNADVSFPKMAPTVNLGFSFQLGLMYGWLSRRSTTKGATTSLTRDHSGTRGVSDALLATAERIPRTAWPNRLIVNETAPRQWLIT